MTDEGGGIYAYTTTLVSTVGNDYTYYFEAEDSTGEIAGFSSPTNEHTFTMVSGYVWVDGEHTGQSDGTEKKPYTTIADGISNASSGQAVRVLPRTISPYEYVETFSMVSGVHLVSDNGNSGDSETTYNDPYSTYSTSMLTRTGRTIIKGQITFPITITDNVVVDGFTVYKSLGYGTMMDIQGKSPIIRNNIVYRYNAGLSNCIQMDGGSGDTNEPIIENNLLHGVGEAGIGVSSYQYPIIQDNIIWDARRDAGIGINRRGTVSPDGTAITIRNNEIFNCAGAGIGTGGDTAKLVGNLEVIIQGNIIHDNGYDTSGEPYGSRGAGIGLERCCSPGPKLGVTIGGPDPAQGNQIYNNRVAGIRLDGNDLSFNPVLIQNNTIYDNGKTGILLINAGYDSDPPEPPVEPDITWANVWDNTIYGHTTTGINIGGTTYANILNNDTYDNATAGITFNMGDVVTDAGTPSSGTVTIGGIGTDEENNIYSNTMAGIAVRDAIAGNEIHENYRGGISIINSCENLFINRNEIHDNFRGGIHTGGFYNVENDYFANSNDECTGEYDPYPCCTVPGTGTCNSSVGFIGNTDSAFLDVSQNKVYGNGLNDIGGGIDIRHASGTIYNNLVYENAMGGIRYGNYIDGISNNTVVDNGIGMMGFGGGIIYDSLDGYVADIPFGNGPSIPIRNNIIAFHPSAGIRTGERGVCLSGDYRDYNLLFGNNNTPIDVTPITWPPWEICPQLGGCWWNDNEIFADPEFVDRDNDDYRIQDTDTSPAVDTGYDLNTDCTGVGVPYPCCTGVDEGTCPTYDYGTDVSVPPGVGTTDIDMGAYGGQYPIDW